MAVNNLANEEIISHRFIKAALNDDEMKTLITQIPGWSIEEIDGIKRLVKSFKFKNFAQALNFTNRVGDLAESADHHPLIVTEWGKVTVSWWTHVIQGLHKNDFIMAAGCDSVFDSEG